MNHAAMPVLGYEVETRPERFRPPYPLVKPACLLVNVTLTKDVEQMHVECFGIVASSLYSRADSLNGAAYSSSNEVRLTGQNRRLSAQARYARSSWRSTS